MAERPPPQQLPSDVFGFTGRTGELAQLDSLLAGAAHTPAVVISAVSGTAGVGKTALAVHWAHQVADRFPDGQLYVDLRGYDPDQPMPPDDALAASLRALGVDGAEIPQDLTERATRYRTLLSGRQMLVVLDNAYAVEQVHPLLPGSGSCFVLVTSRDSLTGLAVRYGARRIDLDLLSPAEGRELLRALVGERVDAEPEAADALIERCAQLPLALRIAAELAVARPSASLAELVAELADERVRLDLFEVGSDERTAVRAVFSWSYQGLAAPAARMFRLLGLHSGADLDGYGAAALAGTGLDEARDLLAVLVRAHLVQENTPGRYRMHDLLRAYAAERADEEAEPDRRAALIRLLHFDLATAAAAMDVLFPAERHRRPRVPAQGVVSPPVDTPALARAWLDTERENLLAAVAYAAAHGWPTQTGYLANTITRYLETAALYNESMAMHRHVLRAAEQAGDRYGATTAHLNLGGACYYLGRYDDATEHFRMAADGFAAEADHISETRALTNLGVIYAQVGRYADALDHYQRALVLARETGDRVQASLLLGWVGLELGRLGRHDEGIAHLSEALAAFRGEVGFPLREAEVLTDLGQVHLWADRPDVVPALIAQALAIEREIGNRYGETHALNIVAEAYRAGGRADEALAHHRQALVLAREIGHREEQARALYGLGHLARAEGRLDEARQHWRDALVLYTALTMPRADEVRAELAALPSP